jgi:hypothetical protein
MSGAEARLLAAGTAMSIAEVAATVMSLVTPPIATLQSMSAVIVPFSIVDLFVNDRPLACRCDCFLGEKYRSKLVGSNGRDRCLEYSGRKKSRIRRWRQRTSTG